MKVKDMIEPLRIDVNIEFRIGNYSYCTCHSTDLFVKEVGDREIEDWFVLQSRHNTICINLKEERNEQ